MKVLIFLLSAVFLFVSSPSLAQLDDIAGKSGKYSGSSNSGSTSGGGGDLDGELAVACIETCAPVCFDIFFSQIGMAMVDHHRYLLDNRESNPLDFSIDLYPNALYMLENEVWGIQPRVRGTFGIFSTDYRMDLLVENNFNTIQKFESWHWQILVFNFSPVEEFNFRFGNGIFRDNTDDLSFYEIYSSIQLRLAQQSTLICLEGRYAPDIETQETVYKELSLNTAFRVIETPHLFGYFTAGFAYQNFYPQSTGANTAFMFIQGGMQFNLH